MTSASVPAQDEKRFRPDLERDIKPFATFWTQRHLGKNDVSVESVHTTMFQELQAALDDEQLNDDITPDDLYLSWFNQVAAPAIGNQKDSSLKDAWKSFRAGEVNRHSPQSEYAHPSHPLHDLLYFNPTHVLQEEGE
jgi:hypothetical protein